MMKELENEEHQMIVDGIDFLKRARDGVDAWRSYVVLPQGNNADPIALAELTKIISYHLREGYFMWKDLPKSWSSHIPLAMACVHVRQLPAQNPTSGNDMKRFRWEHLTDVCKSDMDVVLTAISNNYIQQWEDIPIELQNIECVTFAAWKSFLRWHEKYYTHLTQYCPALNRDFFVSCIEREKIEDWDDLPQEYRTDIEFARRLAFFPSRSIAYSILDEFQELCHERETWIKVLGSAALHNYIGNLLELFAPTTVTSDRPLMLQACQFDTVLRSVHETLGHDRSFLVEVLQKYPQQLVYMDHESQLLFPDLVLSTLWPFSELILPSHSIRKLIDNLDPSFWSFRSNFIPWFTCGFPHPHVLQSGRNIISDLYYDNEEIAVLIAVHCRVDYRMDSFTTTTSDRLRSDKSFMTKIVELDSILILCASDELQTDFDLALMAIGNSQHLYNYYAERQTDFLPLFLDTVRQKLSLHDSFVHLVLGGIMQPQCYLSRLGQDNETTICFKKCIAAYLDVPFGPPLRWLRQCASFRDGDGE